jgi:hypothetical protein
MPDGPNHTPGRRFLDTGPAGCYHRAAMPRLAAFGQELYVKDSLLAARLALRATDRADLQRRLVARLPQHSEKSRIRIAETIVQRLIGGPRRGPVATPLAQLLAETDDTQAQTELVFHRAAVTHEIIAAMAVDIFYPHFVRERPPRGFTREQFLLANTAALFEYDRVITRQFISTYAREVWGFEGEPTISRALRVLRQAGILRPLTRVEERRRVLSYVPTARPLSETAFSYLLYEDCLARKLTRPAIDQIQGAQFARIFLQTPVQIAALADAARRRRLLAAGGAGGARRLALTGDSLDQVVARLLGE